MEIPDKIKYIRQNLFLSQEDFAKELGVAFSTINRWENGKTKPNYRKQKALHELCKKHKINVDD